MRPRGGPSRASLPPLRPHWVLTLSSLPQGSRACFPVLCGLSPRPICLREGCPDRGQCAHRGLTRATRSGGIRWNVGLWCLRGCAGSPSTRGMALGVGGHSGSAVPECPRSIVPPRVRESQTWPRYFQDGRIEHILLNSLLPGFLLFKCDI